MKFGMLAVAAAALTITASAWAGTIHGKVSGVKGESVVYLEANPAKSFPAPAQHAVMDQKNLMFVPHILVIQQGMTVVFHNSDAVEHNVYWPSINGNKKLGHNMGTWPQGGDRSFTFQNPGVVPLYCYVHPDMSGYIIVSPTPYYAQTDPSGNYTIKNVPNGAYTLIAWHEGKRPHSQSITVSGDMTADVTVGK